MRRLAGLLLLFASGCGNAAQQPAKKPAFGTRQQVLEAATHCGVADPYITSIGEEGPGYQLRSGKNGTVPADKWPCLKDQKRQRGFEFEIAGELL